MNINRIRRLIRLHESAEQHVYECRRLSREPGLQSEALKHLRKAERIQCQVSDIIKKYA